jgi:TRAP transporter TAXI family solute receptor
MQNPTRQIYPVLTVLLAVGIVVGLATWLATKNRGAELTLAAGQKGGTYLPLAGGMAERISKSLPKLRIRVIETEGSGENLRLLASGEADMAIVQNDLPHDGSVRTLAPLHRGVLHFIVRADDSVQSILDLPGRRIATGPSESGSPRFVDALLRHFGLDPESLDLRMLGLADACQQLQAGEVDVILMPMGLKSDAFAELVSKGGLKVRFVPIGSSIGEESEIAGFLLDYPRAEAAWIPRHAYAATQGEVGGGLPREAVPAVGVRSVLVAREDLPSHHAHAVTEALFLNQSSLVEAHPVAAQISADIDRSTLQFPLHVGADAYYRRNEPGFLVRYAEVLGLSLSFMIALIGLLATSNRWLLQRKKDRIDGYYLELDRHLGQLQDPELGKEMLIEIEANLEAMRHRAIRLLAEERLLPNESFRIFQGLLADCRREVRRRKSERRE